MPVPDAGNSPHRPALPLSPGTRRREVFAGYPSQVSAARRWAATLLPDCPARDDIASVVAELTSNAVAHTRSGLPGGWFAVQVITLRSAVRVTVTDEGGPNTPRVINDADGDTGRGLLLVSGLSERVGVTGGHQGRHVWAELAWRWPATNPPAGQPTPPLPAGMPNG